MALYANGLAPKSALIPFEGSLFSPDMYVRVRVGVEAIRARGVSITINQGYRFRGVPSDRAIGASDYSSNEAKASQTSTGDANQWYQLGRQDNGSTPSAATPGFSNHGDWDIGAIDSNTSNEGVRAEEFAKVGLAQTIADESWHDAKTSNGTIPLPTVQELQQGDEGVSKQDVLDAFADPIGKSLLGQAINANLQSPDGVKILSAALAQALGGPYGQLLRDTIIPQGVFKNDTSPDGFKVLSAAGAGDPDPISPPAQ